MIGVIRQPIGIPDDILPDAWRNNINSSTINKGQQTCTLEDQTTCLEGEEIEMMKNLLQQTTLHDDDDDPCAVPDDFVEIPDNTPSSSRSTHGRLYRGG
jgi:hypothetical protein